MTDNKPPTDPIAEFQKLRLQTAGMSDELTNTFQLADSRPTSNIEVLKGLDEIRAEIADFKKDSAEMKEKMAHQEDVNRSILEELRAIRKEMAMMKVTMPNSIVEEIIGGWELVENLVMLPFAKFRKFKWNNEKIVEIHSDRRTFSYVRLTLDIPISVVNNRLIHGNRSYHVENSKLHLYHKDVLRAVYHKMN